MRPRWGVDFWAALVAIVSACGQRPPVAGAPAQRVAEVDAARLTAADQDTTDWLMHGRTYGEQRYSPLELINTTNVSTLGLAWSLDLDTARGQEATPLVIDGVMYSSSAWSKVQAIDAATGQLLWQYDPQVPAEIGVKACCDVVNRGVAAWKGRIYVGTLDGRLVALDAKTGKPVWSVVTIDQAKPYTVTGAPRIVKGKVLIGNGGAEFGVRGYVSAYDAESGKLVWRFYTVPGDPTQPFEAAVLKQAAATWSGEWWKSGGGGTVWDSMAYDPELDLLYIGTGNGSPWNQRVRSPGGGDNLFLSSIVALRPDTGEYVWHYQETPGESWDYTATQHIILADLTIDGQARKVLMQAPKNGFFYVLDRTTGKLLSAKPYVTLNWAKEIDLETGRPVVNPDALYGSTGKMWIALPGPIGGHNWQPMSFSPKTQLVYIPTHDVPFAYVDDKNFAPRPIGTNVGIDFAATSLPQEPTMKAQLIAGYRGYLKAWDPVAQKEVWKVEHTGGWNGGVLSTAGNLVFQGTAAGDLVAFDAASGTKLWSSSVQTGVIAAPMTYAVAGQQYVAIVAGWGGAYALAEGEIARKGSLAFNRSRVLAFRLGGSAKLPDPPPPPPAPPAPPPSFGDEATVAQGKAAYHSLCMVCHGDAVVGGGVIVDLRWSPISHDSARWQKVVLEGARSSQGMVGFSKVLPPAEAEAVRAYVIFRANESFKEATTQTKPTSATPATAQ
jgi:alcohol dehydrogenase (cytochrome c)/quinohemoprotein ethanol dehydrogenase